MFGIGKTDDVAGGDSSLPVADGLVAVIVAAGHTVTIGATENIGDDADGKPVIRRTSKSFGPGETLEVSAKDAAELAATGFVLNPKAAAEVDPLGLESDAPSITRPGQALNVGLA